MSDLPAFDLSSDVLQEFPDRLKAEKMLPTYRRTIDEMVERSLGTATGQQLATYAVGVRPKGKTGKYEIYLTPRQA
jgi:hypothetical protein